MVRCFIHGHNQQYKIAPRGDDAEDMCGSSSLEPDPRYEGCCSNMCRPGKVVRDLIMGLLVVLAIAVVIAVIFVIVFYVVPDAKFINPFASSATDNDTSQSSVPSTERTVVSVSGPSGPGTKVEIKSSESESGSVPPLFEILNPRTEPAEQPTLAPATCKPRQLDMCSDMPNALTRLPNWANDQTEEDLNGASLPFFRDVIVRSSCSPRAREYACAILEPACDANGDILPPCRTFCRSVASTCQEFVISGFSLSDVFKCDRFPDSADPAVCFDASQGFSSTPTATATEYVEGPSTVFPEEDEFTTDYVTEGAVTETTSFDDFSTTADDLATTQACPELMCLDGTCLSLAQLNDGISDCPDGTDEQDFAGLFS